MRTRRHHRHSPLAVVIEQSEVPQHVGPVQFRERREVPRLDLPNVVVLPPADGFLPHSDLASHPVRYCVACCPIASRSFRSCCPSVIASYSSVRESALSWRVIARPVRPWPTAPLPPSLRWLSAPRSSSRASASGGANRVHRASTVGSSLHESDGSLGQPLGSFVLAGPAITLMEPAGLLTIAPLLHLEPRERATGPVG
jgi:hypothetical protein